MKKIQKIVTKIETKYMKVETDHPKKTNFDKLF